MTTASTAVGHEAALFHKLEGQQISTSTSPYKYFDFTAFWFFSGQGGPLGSHGRTARGFFFARRSELDSYFMIPGGMVA